MALYIIYATNIKAQVAYFSNVKFTQADTLRGMLRPERTCYDVTHYELSVFIDIDSQRIIGNNKISYNVIDNFTRLQIDLFENLVIDSIIYNNKILDFERKFNAVFITTPEQTKGTHNQIVIYYHGQPKVAENPPWDGGFVWAKDSLQNPFVGVACEGLGASVWFPCKDYLGDEPDSALLHFIHPKDYQVVANGKKVAASSQFFPFNLQLSTSSWKVSYPINNYNITFYLGKFSHFVDYYINSQNDSLTLDYYVLKYNEARAKKHFEQVKPMLGCYEKYFDKYPFWNDGYKLVEAPYLGMEHQSGIAYGNHYERGYNGGLIPADMNWDYLIIHESGHEYFGNAVSCNDHSDMWIHEAFTTYMEALYVECTADYEEAIRYLENHKNKIRNADPIVGLRDVNFSQWIGSDMYFKGAWILHSLRNTFEKDEHFFALLKNLYQHFRFKNIDTKDIINFINTYTEYNYTSFFEQYLYHPNPPKFVYQIEKKRKSVLLKYKWVCETPNFNMSLLVGNDKKYTRIYPTSDWQETIIKKCKPEEFRIATELFYITLLEMKQVKNNE
ncbi:MAG: M1 family metallopeptidase [Saprospiraceae bacterium]|nr:M1 family metallopeptidase [Saprospiraceae bacterium]